MATFGELISDRRRALGLSQKELAAKIRKEDGSTISPQYLNDLERDRRGAPSDYLIGQFARILTMEGDELYYSAGEVSPDLRGLDPKTESVRKAIAAFRRSLENHDAE